MTKCASPVRKQSRLARWFLTPTSILRSILTRAFARVRRGAVPHQAIAGIVSILTRAFARVRPRLPSKPYWQLKFQSSLELSPECDSVSPWASNRCSSFNPHSSFRPSATCGRCRRSGFLFRFNPHSSFRPSATPPGAVVVRACHVSILTRAFARVRRPHGHAHGRIAGVSILTRAFARVRRRRSRRRGVRARTFQSSLELSPECDGGGAEGGG